jgi:hypothetical protein
VLAEIAILWWSARRLSALSPEKQPGYYRIVRTLAAYSGGLAVLWSVGVMFGLVDVTGMPAARSVMTPSGQSMFDWLFLVVWTLMCLRFGVWLYFRGGATVLVEHGDIFHRFPKSADTVKFLWALLFLVGFLPVLRQCAT